MKLDVPYYSQKIDVEDQDWKSRACGVTCLKMVLDFYGKETTSLDELIKLGVDIGAYGSSGWVHQGLVDIAAKSNLTIYRKEFKSDDTEEAQKFMDIGVSEIIDSLENGKPVLVSAIKKFKEPEKFHMVLLVGFEGGREDMIGFYYHDPDAETAGKGKDLFVDIDTFKKEWRRMAIFVK